MDFVRLSLYTCVCFFSHFCIDTAFPAAAEDSRLVDGS